MSRGIPNIPYPFYLRRNDTRPVYHVDIYDADGNAVDLSGTTSVLFTMRGPGSDTTRKVDGEAATVVVGPDGSTYNRLEYTWATGDTDQSGTFSAQFELEWAAGVKRTFPATRKQALEVIISDDWEDA